MTTEPRLNRDTAIEVVRELNAMGGRCEMTGGEMFALFSTEREWPMLVFRFGYLMASDNWEPGLAAMFDLPIEVHHLHWPEPDVVVLEWPIRLIDREEVNT